MATEIFKASVSYGDWKGTSAADEADTNKLRDWLKQNNYMDSGEFLVGISIFAGENHGAHKDPIFVNFLLTSPGDHDSVKAMIDSNYGPIKVKKVSIEMNLNEFFGFFKRFSVSFSSHGMLSDREYIYEE